MQTPTNIAYTSTIRAPCSNLQCRVIVIILAILLILVGFVMFIIGCLLIWSNAMIEHYIKKELNAFLDYTGLHSEAQAKGVLISALLEYTAPLGRILFWIGITIIAMSGLSLYGLIVQNRFVLFLVASMLLAKVLVISVMIVTFHVYPDSVVGLFHTMAWNAIKEYRSMTSSDKSSMVISLVMPMLQCCGMNNGEDFAGSMNFQRKLTSGTHILYINYPLPCCKLKKTYEPVHSNCPKIMDERNSNIKNGCWPILEEKIQEMYAKASYIVIFTTLGEFTLACFLIYISLLL